MKISSGHKWHLCASLFATIIFSVAYLLAQISLPTSSAALDESQKNKSLGYSGNKWRMDVVQRAVGSVVPQPKRINYLNGSNYLTIERDYPFQIILDLHIYGCKKVEDARNRYLTELLFDDTEFSNRDDQNGEKGKQIGRLYELHVTEEVNTEFLCESMPHDKMDETYSLKIEILEPSRPGHAILSAKTSWGIIRGLETFSQLIFRLRRYPSLHAVRPVEIEDGPRFNYRGYMLDTSRHYISMETIKKLLDAMAFNKLNVFHWHLFDDQSIPYVSSNYPEILNNTSYRPDMTYNESDVKCIIDYAADRGIRVIPEIDTPGHTYALRNVQNLLTKCYDETKMKPNGDFGPIDPTKIDSYKTVSKLIGEMSSLFNDEYFHAGGDEVNYDCWKSNPSINEWMAERNISGNYRELNRYYMRRLFDILTHFKRTTIVWQEVFDDGAELPNNTIVQVWKYGDNQGLFMEELRNIVRAGYKALMSSCWYLNIIGYGQDWIKYYQCDPVPQHMTKNEEDLILGGEICMWTEFVDDTNVLTRTWPRASAAAERLWSPKELKSTDEFRNRLEQIRCRLISRGISAEPVSGPSYC